jgi:hypothetical protein
MMLLTIIHKNKLFFLIVVSCLFMILIILLTSNPSHEDIQNVEKIWSDEKHNAFPSIVFHDNEHIIAFRSASGHMRTDGNITLIKKDLFGNWKIFAKFSVDNKLDARDPKLSINPKGNIYVIYAEHEWSSDEKRILKTRTNYVIGKKNSYGQYTFTKPAQIQFQENQKSELPQKIQWLWDVTWNNNKAYGFLYTANSSSVWLMSSNNGIYYSLIKKVELTGKVNEGTIIFSDNEMKAVIRNNAGNAFILSSLPPYENFKVNQLSIPTGGPHLFILNNHDFLLTRFWEKISNRYTTLGVVDKNIFKPLIYFPSIGDTGYGDVLIEKDYLIVTYYSTLNHDENSASNIYLARVNKNYIMRRLNENFD